MFSFAGLGGCRQWVVANTSLSQAQQQAAWAKRILPLRKAAGPAAVDMCEIN